MEKIQELTDKLFREGVEKGQAEAERLIAEAKAEAAQIVEAAKTQAATIEQQARKQAAETEQNTKNELKLYMGQALNALKGEIANTVCGTVVGASVDKVVGDPAFLGQFCVALAREWAKNEDIVISTADAANLKAYFAHEAKELLDHGVTINEVNNRATLFTISPADGSYRVNFGKEEFENYFKAFLRPQLADILF